ncbi:MAG: hypothetical protein KDH94_03335, partial [Coxiellaceae bacterium]|nr:hypothetical protein [Coxiellaceae bacterium]
QSPKEPSPPLNPYVNLKDYIATENIIKLIRFCVNQCEEIFYHTNASEPSLVQRIRFLGLDIRQLFIVPTEKDQIDIFRDHRKKTIEEAMGNLFNLQYANNWSQLYYLDKASWQCLEMYSTIDAKAMSLQEMILIYHCAKRVSDVDLGRKMLANVFAQSPQMPELNLILGMLYSDSSYNIAQYHFKIAADALVVSSQAAEEGYKLALRHKQFYDADHFANVYKANKKILDACEAELQKTSHGINLSALTLQSHQKKILMLLAKQFISIVNIYLCSRQLITRDQMILYLFVEVDGDCGENEMTILSWYVSYLCDDILSVQYIRFTGAGNSIIQLAKETSGSLVYCRNDLVIDSVTLH